jgi:acyl-CoA reductase-like NAD-dependent aldehyde dehydrogenase
MTEEIFGPILPLKIYSKLEEVISEIGARPKPLVVYAFSSDKKNIERLRNNTISGSFVINDVVVQLLNPNLPFGGVGASGYGRYHGKAGF